MKEALAEITLDLESREIRDLSLLEKHFRFKCTRCAIFCCRLGGPELTKRDVERIKETGYREELFLEPTNSESESLSIMWGTLKNREDGSCVFLKSDSEHKRYECSIYDFRPVLCRLYPFNFDRVNSNTVVLKFIPCCKGLNNSEGETINKMFIANHLLTSLLEAIKSF